MVYSFILERLEKLSRNGIGSNINRSIYEQIRKCCGRYVSCWRDLNYDLTLDWYVFKSHDDIAKLLNIPATPFDVMYPDKYKEMKRMVLDYIKILRRDNFSEPQTGENVNVNGIQRNKLDVDTSGFPL